MKKKSIALIALMALVPFLDAEECKELYTGGFGLKDAKVSFSPRIFYPGWYMKFAVGNPKIGKDASYKWRIPASSDEANEYPFTGNTEFKISAAGDVSVTFEYDTVKDVNVKNMFIGADFKVSDYAGGKVVVDGQDFPLSKKHKSQTVFSRKVSKMTFFKAGGIETLTVALPSPVPVFLQDDRYAGGDKFALRIYLRNNKYLSKAGEKNSMKMTISAPGGIVLKEQKEVIVKASEDWIPVDSRFDVNEGGPLDLSSVRKTGIPAGKYGYPVVRGGHFEFENLPGVPQKFYGVNLVFGGSYPKEEVAPIYAKNLAMVGYNSVRVHHHDELMTKGRDGTLDPEAMKRFDSLMAACISNGLYITTDFYVSRRVPFKDCGIDREGNIAMAEFKELVMFHEGVYSNYIRHARAFLSHVNPHTGRRYADEPALGWISFVNEGNLGNFDMKWINRHKDIVLPHWTSWLEKKAKSDSRYADIPQTLPKGIRMSPRTKNAHSAAFVRFLADTETKFARRVTDFLRNEMKCKALTTNMNCWYYPSAYQLPRTVEYDYVDDHFYIDHPSFLDQSWRLPSRCPNTNPFKDANEGAMAPVIRRVYDRPFTITEFNYSSPGRYRGVGGIATGTMAALQDWAGVWRFAWSHGEKGTEEPTQLSYFNVSGDPLTLASERAIICLYLRGDVKPLKNKLAYHVKPSAVAAFKDGEPDVPSAWNKLGWYSQIGCAVSEKFPEGFGTLGEYNSSKKAEPPLAGVGGAVKVDSAEGRFEIDTPFTAGGFGESGAIATASFNAEISEAPCAVWVSSLDSKPIEKSSRLLLTHLTDVQNTYSKFADDDFTILRSWGRLPHLMRRGKARVSIKSDKRQFEVWSLSSTGERRERIPATYKDGRIEFVCDTARDMTNATFLYEITSPSK